MTALSEYEADRIAVQRLLKAYDDIAHEHRATLLGTHHDKISSDDILGAEPDPICKHPRLGKPYTLRGMIGAYLLRWVFELIYDESGSEGVVQAFANSWLQIRGMKLDTEQFHNDRDLIKAMEKYWK